MRDLSELKLQVAYHKGKDDIANNFYLPCMERAQRYDRAVGYFRSTAFLIAWPALKGFIARDGTMNILCSQVLADQDVEALEQGYAGRADELLGARLHPPSLVGETDGTSIGEDRGRRAGQQNGPDRLGDDGPR